MLDNCPYLCQNYFGIEFVHYVSGLWEDKVIQIGIEVALYIELHMHYLTLILLFLQLL